MKSTHRIAFASLAWGLFIIAITQVVAPHGGPPLYDGVMPLEPYLWADPPPDHPGGAQGASGTVTVASGKSDLMAVATPELSPQAQVFAVPGALTLPRGATSVKVAITPIAPTADPPTGYIDGNVYRFSVTDQAGHPVTANASQRVSIVLRSADPTLADAQIARFDGEAWRPLTTSPPDMPGGGFLAVVTEFGDFAVVANGVSPYPTPPTDGSTVPAEPSATAGASAPRPSATPAPNATSASTGGPGLDPVAIAIVVVAVGGVIAVAARSRRRRRSRPYRGARRVR